MTSPVEVAFIAKKYMVLTPRKMMASWKSLNNVQNKLEIKQAVRCVLLIIIGVSFDICVMSGHALIRIENFESIAVAIIQIHATILTLTIALLALIGSRINESYMGVRFNDYVLNIKPYLFKQRTIVGVSFVILALSIFACMFRFYNLVVILLLTGLYIIWISVVMIYDAFAGGEKLEKEIEEYVKYRSQQNESFRDILNGFVDDWIESCTLKQITSTEEYAAVFEILFKNLFASDEGRTLLLSNCIKFSIATLREESVCKYGMKFVHSAYDMAWSCIRKNNAQYSESSHEFDLLRNVYVDLCRAIEKTSIYDNEACFSWKHFIDQVVYVGIYMNCGNEEDKRIGDIEYAKALSGTLGCYISNQRQRNNDYWGCPLSEHYELSGLAEYADNVRTVICQCRFRFIVALIKSGDIEFIKEYCYHRGVKFQYQVRENYAWLTLQVHCYCYYLAYYENAEFIDAGIIKKCRMLLEDSSVQSSFREMIEQIAFKDNNIFKFMPGRDYDIFNDRLEDKLLKDLYGYEELPVNMGAKLMVIENAIRDFSILLKLFIAVHHSPKDFLERAISPGKSLYYHSVFLTKNDSKAKINSFFALMGYTYDDKRIDQIYATLEMTLRKCYKTFFLQRIELTDNKLVDIDPIREKTIEKAIKDSLEKTFESIIVNKNDGHPEQWIVMHEYTSTDRTIEEIFLDIKRFIPLNFFQCLKAALIKGNKLKMASKESFEEDDDRFLQYLAENVSDNTIVIGSEYTLSSFDFVRQNEIDDLINLTKHCLLAGAEPVIILNNNSVKLCINSISVDLLNVAIKDFDAKFISDKNVYEYNQDGIPIELSEDELLLYLNSSRRRIIVRADVSIETDGGIIGQMLSNN